MSPAVETQRGAVAIFVKTPGLSPVKTRLQAGRGRAFAEQWHQLAARACGSVIAGLVDDIGVHGYWAVAEASAIGHPLWSSLPCVAQGDGGLGARMAQVHSTLVERHGFGMLIGADAPQLRVETLVEAAAWLRLDGARSVLGFAEDGGFWLFGSNRVMPLAAWTGVRYSGRETGRDFRLAMSRFARCLMLPSLRDVDDEDDLAPVFDALRRLPDPTADQQALADWLQASLTEAAQ